MADDISMDKAYSAKDIEDAIYALWMEAGVFAPEKSPLVTEKSESFSIVLPPPNVTGTLHMGHAAMLAIEDTMVRYARMSGKRTLWIPGTDHAAIATESKVEKLLMEKESKTRHDLGREGFLTRVREFAQDSHDTIVNQMKKMGASVDWGREAYTLDEARNVAVRTAFERMHDDALIYRGYRVINWDPIGQTSVSDDEVVHKEITAKLYTFKYGKDFPISIATTRPETKVGDTAVAVNPKDARYTQYIGKEYKVTFAGVDLTIKVIADDAVDASFGTGALGVTPAHSAIDADMAQRHQVPMVQVIGEDGRMRKEAGALLTGKTTLEAREAVAAWIREAGLMEKEEETVQNLSTAERTGGTIEPLPKEQWFIDVDKPFWLKNSKRAKIEGLPRWRKVTLKEVMQHVVRSHQIKILPERFEKTYFHWIDNLRDWNISRQIWFGHQVPVWYCLACQKPHVNLKVKNKWFFVRHGETDWNKNGIIQGHSEVSLNENGKAQARKAADQLKATDIGLIVSSDIGRCKETAAIIAEATGAPIEYDARFRERSFGSIEGMHQDEMRAKYGTMQTFDQIADVELFGDVETRVAEAFAHHRQEIVGKNVVIVSHGAAIRMLVKHIRKLSPEASLARPSVKNAELLSADVGETACACGSDLFEQDSDTLDTWFSSGLWTFSTLGWPEETDDFKNFHPTSVLETGYDILFFWVARMILMSTYLVGEIPFRTVYLHGLVRDEQGRKMSKSLGNIIDPLDMIDKYGADATRMSLLVGSTPGNDLALSEEKIASFRNFTNKLWNIARFVFMAVEKVERQEVAPTPKTVADKWILAEFAALVERATNHYEKYEYSLLGETLREFTWTTFADWYIEIAKIQKRREEEDGTTDKVLLYVLEGVIKMWHPFMPFVTEEVYKQFHAGMVIVAPWPKPIVVKGGAAAIADMVKLQGIVVAVRNIRAQYKVEPKQVLDVYVANAGSLIGEDSGTLAMIEGMVRAKLVLDQAGEGPMATAIVEGIRLSVPLQGIVDMDAERAKLQKAIEEARGRVASIEGRLSNKEYVANAPAAVVDASRAQLEEAKGQFEALNKEFERLNV